MIPGQRKALSEPILQPTPASATCLQNFHSNLLVEWIRLRIFGGQRDCTMRSLSFILETNPKNWSGRERIEAFRREKRWKIEIAFSLTFPLAPPCAVEWIFPQALFSVWVLVFTIQVAFDGSRAEVEPCRQGTESQFQ